MEKRGKNVIVIMEGELDHHTSAEAREKIDRYINMGIVQNLIFDFKNLKFMDSSGIGVIIGRYKLMQKNDGKVAVVDANPHINRIITISGLHKIVSVYKNLDDALQTM
jgi:stage II sporulation protein AA (anti-sigma F factor antagonist)